MTTVVNDRDVLLQAATRDLDPRANKYLNMSVTTPLFHVAANGTPYPPSIDISVLPVNITGGTVSFSVGSGGTLTGTGNTRNLAFTDMSVDTLTITASITDLGQTYTAQQIISKVVDGSTGRDGSSTAAPMYATAYVYMWSPVQPSLPAGSTTWAWNTGSNTAYTGADGWYVSPPANPGTSGIQLWVCSKPITATSGTVTNNVTYSSGAALYAVAQNGSNGGQGTNGAQGVPGVPGIKNAVARAYQWGNGAAPTATGTAIWTWATASYNQLPASGWNVQKTNAPALGYTLFEAAVPLVDSTGATTSSIDWTTATITAIGYMATNGSQGPQGPQGGAGPQGGTGASAVIAYTLIDGATLAATPATTTSTGATSKPAVGTWGETRSWTDQPSSPAAGQAVFQTNGIYNPANNIITWGVPYRSDIRVGSLSAITTNTGTLNVSGTISSANGNFTVDANGAATMKALTIKDASGNTVLSSSGALNPAYAAAGTLNSDLTPSINSAATTANWTSVSNRPADDAIKNNLLDLSWWKRDGSIPWPSNNEYNRLIMLGTDLTTPGPKGSNDVVWFAQETTGDSNSGGGWSDVSVAIDPTKTYRFVVPIKRIDGTGSSYWGTNNVCALNTTGNQANPYFANSGTLPAGEWFLFVGYIFPAGSTGNTNDGAGIYRCSTGALYAGGSNFNHTPGATTVNHRAYQYYASLNAKQIFGRPMVNVVDGTEPSLREYFAASAVLNSAQLWSDVTGSGRPQDNANYTTNTNQLVDGAGLGLTASWANVSGTGKPADYATVGAAFGVNIGGQITAANVATYMGANTISSTYIKDLAADKLTAGTLAAGIVYAGQVNANQINAGTLNSGVVYAGSVQANQIAAGTLAAGVVYAGTVNANQISAGSLSAISGTIGTLRTASSGGRVEISDNIIKVFDTNSICRVKLGNLAL